MSVNLNPYNVKNLRDASRLDESIHAVVSPSAMPRVSKCPASVQESMKVPPKPSGEAAKKGTLLHAKVVEAMTSPYTDWAHDLSVEDRELVKVALRRITATHEQAIMHLRDNGIDHTPQIYYERRASLAQWGHPEIFGTIDLLLPTTLQCYVTDWKFGFGHPVYTTYGDRPNEQLMLCAAMMCNPKVDLDDGYEFILRIDQPPLGYSEAVTITRRDIHTYMEEFKEIIADVVRPDPPYNPGIDQCKFCDAKLTCLARYWATHASASHVRETYHALKKGTVTAEQLSHVLQSAKMLKKYISDVEKGALEMALSGTRIPTQKVVRGKRSRKWKDEGKAAEFLEDFIEEEDLYTTKVCSPSQAEKKCRKLLKSDAFKELINVMPGKPQLVHEDDPREEFKEFDAKSAFAEYDKSN